jgi:undecaprenyl-diphosphatase
LCKVLQVIRREFSTRRRRLIVLAALAAAVYLTMWFGWVQGWGWVDSADSSTLEAAHRIGVEHPVWATFWNVWCSVFSPLSFRVLVMGFVVYALVRGRLRLAVFLFVSVELSGLLTEGAKRLADRPRPDTAMVHAASTSFPSGHAVGSMVAVLVLALLLLPHVRRTLRPWLTTAGFVIVLSVGVGRVALNVHHLSDVVAGWALGYLYFALCSLILWAPRIMESDETPAGPGI